MEEVDGKVLDGLKLMGRSWRAYAAHVRTYLSLMILAVLALVLLSFFALFVIAPGWPQMNPREVWMGMGTLQKLGIIVTFFASLAVFYRTLAASMFATNEFSEGRDMGALGAFRRVSWKHTRLFWLMMVGIFFGRFAPIVALIAGFFFAPAFPAAVLEDLGAFQALKRGDKLGVGNQLRIATIYVAYLVVVTVMCATIFGVLGLVHDQFGSAWYTKPVPSIGFLILFTLVQWYMIALTLNYQQQRRKLTENSLPYSWQRTSR